MDRSSEIDWTVSSLSSFIMFTSNHNQLDGWSSLTMERSGRVRRVRPGLFSAFLSGSKAEFYIQPTVEHCDDTDIMITADIFLAFADGSPSIMPRDIRDFDEVVSCYKIISIDKFPGYCVLQLTGVLEFQWELQEYNSKLVRFESDGYDVQCYLIEKKDTMLSRMDLWKKMLNDRKSHELRGMSSEQCNDVELIGPSMRLVNYGTYIDSFDSVSCIWCPQWPTEAAEWSFRPRKHCWPTKAMIQTIVDNGCHLVKVCHPDCPEDKTEHQYRFSFSHAEVILIRSWTPVQQVAYHILRYFAKRELIKKDCQKEDEILTGYHLKTIMLWICEKEPTEWWTSAPVLVILCRILQQLSNWLRRKNIPNYFIPRANLLCKKLHLENFITALEKIDHFSNVINLMQWFLTSYVSHYYEKVLGIQSVKPMASEMKRCLGEINLLTSQENAVNFCMHLRGNIVNCLSYSLLFKSNGSHVTSGRCLHWPNQAELLPLQISRETDMLLNITGVSQSHQISSRFVSYRSSILLLYAEYLVSSEGMTYGSEFVADALRGIPMEIKNMCIRSHTFPQTYRSMLRQSHVLLLRAQEVMETLLSTADSEFHVLSRVALELLTHSLETNDSDSESVKCTAVVYTAAVCHAHLVSQATIEMCTLALYLHGKQARHEVKEGIPRSLNALCLLFIDDVARLTGFLLLFYKLQNIISFSKTRLHQLLNITPRVFVHYLLHVTGAAPNYCTYKRWSQRFESLSLHALDVLLNIFTKRRHQRLLGRCTIHSSCVKRDCVYLRRDSIVANKMMKTFTFDVKTATIMLFEWCIERLDTFANDAFHQYGIVYSAPDCYRALYLYKCCRWLETKHICHKLSLSLDVNRCNRTVVNTFTELFLKGVIVLPPFDGFFDSDIQFLLGLQTLCLFYLPEQRAEYHFSETELKMRHIISEIIRSGATLANFAAYEISLLFMLSRGFVAQYLMLKTAIALGESRSIVYSLFCQIDSVLPFEGLVHTYLHHKFRKEGWKEMEPKYEAKIKLTLKVPPKKIPVH